MPLHFALVHSNLLVRKGAKHIFIVFPTTHQPFIHPCDPLLHLPHSQTGCAVRTFSALPAHTTLAMPALSPVRLQCEFV